MEVKKQLNKQIVIEVIALFFLFIVIIYGIVAINVSDRNQISSQDGMVLVLDETNFKGLDISSDGEGLNSKGITYTITNNNKNRIEYKVVIKPNITDEDILKYIKVGVDDIEVNSLTDLEKIDEGYVITDNKLRSGFTKIHLFKYWFSLDAPEDVLNKKISFEYDVVTE